MNDDAGSDLPIRFDILTLFPEMFPPVLDTSIPGRAAKANAAEYAIHDLRDWAEPGGHRKVDDRPFGGGPGMVLMCQPIHDAVCAVEKLDERKARRIVLSPQGRPLDQRLLEELANESRLLLIAGHYEGIDERVVEHLELEEISLGDFVLSGGEPEYVLVDGIAGCSRGCWSLGSTRRRTPSRRFRRQTSVDCSIAPTTRGPVSGKDARSRSAAVGRSPRSHNGGFGKGKNARNSGVLTFPTTGDPEGAGSGVMGYQRSHHSSRL